MLEPRYENLDPRAHNPYVRGSSPLTATKSLTNKHNAALNRVFLDAAQGSFVSSHSNSACENKRKGQDCISRNARHLCDVCEELLSDAEHREREIAFLVADMTGKAARTLATMKRKPRRCIRRDTTNDDRTCADRGVTPCAFCVSKMTPRQLRKHATKVIDDREEQRRYWDEYNEAQEYEADLRASGMKAVDWNIESCDSEETTAYKFWLFLASRPCWQSRKVAAA